MMVEVTNKVMYGIWDAQTGDLVDGKESYQLHDNKEEILHDFDSAVRCLNGIDNGGGDRYRERFEVVQVDMRISPLLDNVPEVGTSDMVTTPSCETCYWWEGKGRMDNDRRLMYSCGIPLRQTTADFVCNRYSRDVKE